MIEGEQFAGSLDEAKSSQGDAATQQRGSAKEQPQAQRAKSATAPAQPPAAGMQCQSGKPDHWPGSTDLDCRRIKFGIAAAPVRSLDRPGIAFLGRPAVRVEWLP